MPLAKFTWPAKRVFEQSITQKTLITRFKSGKENRRSKGPPRRRWFLGFQKERNNFEQIEQFFLDRKGEFESFEWDFKDDKGDLVETVKVRLDGDTMKWSNNYFAEFDFGLVFIEVL